jgi:hypothetical protein
VSAFAELARTAAALEPERVLGALDATLAAWRAPGSPWRARLAKEHGVYSSEGIERGVTLGLAGWTRPALAALRAREIGPGAVAPGVTAVWLAGSVPTAAFGALLLPLVAGSAVYAKPASADPLSPRLFAESLEAADPLVASALALGDDLRSLARADAVVAHGSDETVTAIRARVPVHARFVAHGHKLSAAVVGRDADPTRAADALALDAALYDGRGCLSPAYAFVEDVPAGRAGAFARELARALERISGELPRGPLAPAEQVALQSLRAASAARGDDVLASKGSLAWTVIACAAGGPLPAPGALRALPVVPFADAAQLAARLGTLQPHLSTLGGAGFSGRGDLLERLARDAGASRVCALGHMQLPPIDWHHDGYAPLGSLLRWIDAGT